MNNPCISIAISGLGSTTANDLKIRLRNVLPSHIGINWTHAADPNMQCILINEMFFDHNNIQDIIQSRKIPYLKISKHNQTNDIEDNLLCIPIEDELFLRNWVDQKLLNHVNKEETEVITEVPTEKLSASFTLKESHFFSRLYEQDSRKVMINDQFGAIAIIDHYAHVVWLEPTRKAYQTDLSIHYYPANISDFIKVSRKHQYNLENWLFNFVWKNPNLLVEAELDQYYRLKFWPQPNLQDKKILLQLTACFIRGADIHKVAEKLNLPLEQVKHFILANLAIQNVEIISQQDCRFQHTEQTEQPTEETGFLKSLFGKLKSRFKF